MTAEGTAGTAVRPPPGPVLVTGAAGYLGHLAALALVGRGVETIIGFDVAPLPEVLTARGVVPIEGDIRDHDLAALLRRFDVTAVVHLAAIVNPPPGMTAEELHDIEVGGTRRLVDACLDTGVEHLTVASSGAAYGYEPDNEGRWLSEDDPLHGSDVFAYARHKREVEELLAAVRDDHPELGQLVLRPGTVLGAGTRNQITALFEAPAVPGLIGTDVPFVFVWDRDVADVVAMGVSERRTGVYNLAGDGTVTLREIARLMRRPYLPLPASLVRAGLRVVRPLRLVPYGPEQVDFLRYRPVLANDRLKADFAGLPRATSREAFDIWRSGRHGAAPTS